MLLPAVFIPYTERSVQDISHKMATEHQHGSGLQKVNDFHLMVGTKWLTHSFAGILQATNSPTAVIAELKQETCPTRLYREHKVEHQLRQYAYDLT